MSDPERSLAAARADADRARDRLLGTVHVVQERLSPGSLAEQAKEGFRVRKDKAVDAARAQPVIAGGIAVALVAFIARKPIASLFRRLRRKKHKEPAEPAFPMGDQT